MDPGTIPARMDTDDLIQLLVQALPAALALLAPSSAELCYRKSEVTLCFPAQELAGCLEQWSAATQSSAEPGGLPAGVRQACCCAWGKPGSPVSALERSPYFVALWELPKPGLVAGPQPEPLDTSPESR